MFNRRLFLIPIWLVAQYIWNLYQQGSFAQAFAAMTSLDSLWVSFIVTIAIIYYATKASGKPDESRKPSAPKETPL